jgi:hypothetical protein
MRIVLEPYIGQAETERLIADRVIVQS